MPNPLTPQEFLSLLRHFKFQLPGVSPPRIGLAVSGGVDSMALAYLASRCVAGGVIPKEDVIPYIVDHSFRQGSGKEATRVKRILQKDLGLSKAKILKIDWSAFGGIGGVSRGRFEQDARKARYNILSEACVNDGVKKLLLGHHRDDQVETVIMRLIAGSGYHGLSGVQRRAPVPESGSVWGSWDLELWRPLLDVPKQRLIDTCTAANVRWFEDHTNADPELTIRNAIRALLRDPFLLPPALRPDSIAKAAATINKANDAREKAAIEAIKELQPVINLAMGTVEITIDRDMPSRIPFLVMQKAFQIIVGAMCPDEVLKGKTNAHSVLRLFPSYPERERYRIGIQPGRRSNYSFSAHHMNWERLYYSKNDKHLGSIFKRVGDTNSPQSAVFGEYEVSEPRKEIWRLSRQIPAKDEVSTLRTEFGTNPDDDKKFHLWDGRYWIKIMEPKGVPITVRALSMEDYRNLDPARDKLLQYSNEELRRRKAIREEVKRIDLILRDSMPVIEIGKKIIALPTIGFGSKSIEYRMKHKAMWALRGISGIKFIEWQDAQPVFRYYPVKGEEAGKREDSEDETEKRIKEGMWRMGLDTPKHKEVKRGVRDEKKNFQPIDPPEAKGDPRQSIWWSDD